ncbi:hypothetical protein [Thalassomonas haliotis]|uniref:Uncharacterized protein n=1 Tax=Thalassomonas haliotis TaxID=485448 RepID=A0ABY7VAJ8_9GAMM|nr:hypothetical protein [Thalassomonas haliotis]WDE10561.1 hypothetical protein H3N35_20195 [Thalassomonas haliotis]
MNKPFDLEKMLKISNVVFWSALGVTILSLFAVYGFYEYLSIGQQVALHIATIIFAGVFKLGYVLRLVAQKELGLAVR